jgi:amino-acid N-acetyltransferase
MPVHISANWRVPDIPAGLIDDEAGGGVATAVAPVVPVGPVTVRPATIADMRRVEPLIRNFAAENLMLPKSTDQLARAFREFVVAVDAEDTLLGCGALRIYTEDLGEICSLAVDRHYQNAGIGRLIVQQLIGNARALELETVFALTLRPDFFAKMGFQVTPKETFPLKVWADCRSCPKLHACDEIAVARRVDG